MKLNKWRNNITEQGSIAILKYLLSMHCRIIADFDGICFVKQWLYLPRYISEPR